MKYVLVACEESQEVCIAFRKKGFEAYSCDIKPCSGAHPEWHICCDIFEVVSGFPFYFYCQDNSYHYVTQWDLIIAHPPCTYLTCTGNRWFNVDRYGEKAIERMKLREEAAEFFMKIINIECDKIAVENPVGIMNTRYRKPAQIVQPYMFGDPYEKRTCLWLKGLPPLVPTQVVKPEARAVYSSGVSMPAWYSKIPKGVDRSTYRSKTFPGIAKAMAEQWGAVL